MSAPAKWDWSVSNGTATAEATAAAYTALTSGGLTSAFTSPVWNDILAKISEQRLSWDDSAWDRHGLSLANTRMSSGGRMTALRFNTAAKNMPPIKSWPWQESLGRTDLKLGDRCYGAYFVYLTDGLNRWMDLIPIPTGFAEAVISELTVDGHVLPVLHVIAENPFEITLTPEVKARVSPVAPIKYDLKIDQNGALDVTVFTVNSVQIINFIHVNFRTRVVTLPTAHAITELNMVLHHNTYISLGWWEHLSFDLPVLYSAFGTITIDTLLSMCADIVVGTFSTIATVRLTQRALVIFDLIAKLQTETLLLERDAVPLHASLLITDSISFAISCQLINVLTAHLISVFTANMALSSADSVNSVFSLPMLATISLGVSAAVRQIFGATLNWAFCAAASAHSGHSAPTGANLRSLSTISASVQALRERFTGSEILIQSAINVIVGCKTMQYGEARLVSELSLYTSINTKAMQSLIASIPALFNATVKGVVALQNITGAHLNSTSMLNATAITYLMPRSIHLALSLHYALASSVALVSDLLGFTAFISGGFNTDAQISLLEHLVMSVSTLYQFTGTANISAAPINPVIAEINGQHSSTATVSPNTVAPINGALQMVHTVKASVSFIAPTLVSEIDDDLASDLDGILVADVELSSH